MSEPLQPAEQQPVQQKIGNIALLVADYDDAIAFYTTKLQFSLVADTDLGGGKRWVEIAPNAYRILRQVQLCLTTSANQRKPALSSHTSARHLNA